MKGMYGPYILTKRSSDFIYNVTIKNGWKWKPLFDNLEYVYVSYKRTREQSKSIINKHKNEYVKIINIL